jgi:hypothetical protein
MILVQGDAPSHSAKTTQEFLSANCPEFVKSTEWPPNSSDLNALYYHVWNELKQLVYKNQREPFQSLGLLQQRIENVRPLVSQDNIWSAINHWKRWDKP